MYLKMLFLITFFTLISLTPSIAQTGTNDDVIENSLDTLYLSYHFVAGDSLLYNVTAHDSIIVDYGEALVKDRYEKFLIICDSVGIDGKFHLRQQLISFNSKEFVDEGNAVERNFTPWLNRYGIFTIDSLGRRSNTHSDDSTKAALTPGGAFQPVLFFGFNEYAKHIGESWMYKSEDKLPENGVPMPLLNSASLFRLMPDIDTLGRICHQISYVRTSQGSLIGLVTDKNKLALTSVINSGGILLIDTAKKVPMYLFQSLEQKLKFITPNQIEKPVSHFINIWITLENDNFQTRANRFINTIQIEEQKNIKKKTKK